MKENSKSAFFTKDPVLSPFYEKMELVEAFKIENHSLLRLFEARLRKCKDSFLKGLFVPVKKKKLIDHALFGF